MSTTLLAIALAAALTPGLATAPEGFYLDVPFVHQLPRNCGPAALAMALRYWGRDVDQIALASKIDPNRTKGISAADLERLGRDQGFRTTRLAGTDDRLRRLLQTGRPAIVALAPSGNGPNHFVLVVGWAESTGEWFIHDPAEGPYRRIRAASFASRWNRLGNWALLVEPDPAFMPVARPSPEPSHHRSNPADPYWKLASVFFRQQRNEDAKRALRQGLALAPSDPYGHDFLATLLYLDGRKVEALHHWNLAGAPVVRRVIYRGPDGEPLKTPVRLYGINEGEILTRSRWLDVTWIQAQVLSQQRATWRLVPIDDDNWSLEIDLSDRAPSALSPWKASAWRNALSAALEREVSVDVPTAGESRASFGLRWKASQQRLRASWEKSFVHASDRFRVDFNLTDEAWRRESVSPAVRLQSGEIGLTYTNFLPARRAWSAHVGYLAQTETPELSDLAGAMAGFAIGSIGWLQIFGLDKSDNVQLELTGRAEGYLPASGNWKRAHRAWSSASIRWRRSDARSMTMLGRLSAGTAGGGLPLDRSFVLGVGPDDPLPLRAHPTLTDGVKGGGPIGRHFGLVNLEVDRRIARLRGLELRGFVFADTAFVSSPPSAWMKRQLFTDTGAGIRLRLADQIVEVLFSRDLRSGGTHGWVGLSRDFGPRLW